MKKVLMIACSFPPLGGPGVQRTLKFVKYLRNFGYEPIVFTRECKNETVLDESLLSDIPNGVEIIRTKDCIYTDLSGIMKIPGKVISRLMVPDYAAIWWRKARKAAEDIIKKEDIKIIYSTSAPYSDHLLALYLKKKYPHLKWVADFRDEWTKNPYFADDKLYKLKAKREQKLESEVLENADNIIANTPIMRDNFVENRKHLLEKFHVIPNGFDIDDFKNVFAQKYIENSKMTLTYTGAFYGRRKPDTFFAAVQKAVEEGLVDKDKISVRLVGNYNENQLIEKIKKYNLEDVVNLVGLLPHDKCIIEQVSSDALILIEGTGKGAEAFYTGKLFEYLNTNKPILAILPENGVAADLVRESNVGAVASFDDVEQIKSAIVRFYNQWNNNGIEYSPNMEVINRFDRRKQTQELAEIFDKL